MRVGLDVRLQGYAGIGRYVTGLWGALLGLGVDVVALASDRRASGWLGDEHYAAAGPSIHLRARPFGLTEQAAVPRVLRRSGVLVHHATYVNVPYGANVPIVVTVYDLFPLGKQSNARSRAAALYYRLAFPAAIRRASMLVAISDNAARQLQEVFGVPDRRLRVVELGIDHEHWQAPSPAAISRVMSRFGLEPGYLLYVGTTKSHKNLAALLNAHNRQLPPLVLAGPRPEELPPDTLRQGTSHLRVLGRVPDGVLPALYAGAVALVLPSLYESVGFTALEAMACGTPVVCSDSDGLRETVGEAGVFVPPTDVGAWAESLDRVCADDDLQREMSRAGTARVMRRSWRRCAEQHLRVYEEVA
jgi:alpha-1,3-rhamnosyl/mannosyltransferase